MIDLTIDRSRPHPIKGVPATYLREQIYVSPPARGNVSKESKMIPNIGMLIESPSEGRDPVARRAGKYMKAVAGRPTNWPTVSWQCERNCLHH
jgi:hypothetical protein